MSRHVTISSTEAADRLAITGARNHHYLQLWRLAA
jgi:hypothetical protein